MAAATETRRMDVHQSRANAASGPPTKNGLPLLVAMKMPSLSSDRPSITVHGTFRQQTMDLDDEDEEEEEEQDSEEHEPQQQEDDDQDDTNLRVTLPLRKLSPAPSSDFLSPPDGDVSTTVTFLHSRSTSKVTLNEDEDSNKFEDAHPQPPSVNTDEVDVPDTDDYVDASGGESDEDGQEPVSSSSYHAATDGSRSSKISSMAEERKISLFSNIKLEPGEVAKKMSEYDRLCTIGKSSSVLCSQNHCLVPAHPIVFRPYRLNKARKSSFE